MNSKPRDTGGEFTGATPSGPQVAAKGPRMALKARLPTFAAHEQTGNSEFATSVPRDRFHTARLKAAPDPV